MNFIGKIFVVLIFIMSIVFMTLAAVVYGTHRNWEQAARDAEQKLSEARTDFDELQGQYNRLESDLRRQIAAQVRQVAKLETERDLLVQNNAKLQTDVDTKTTQVREAVAAVEATEQNNNRLATENEGLRTEIREEQTAADEAFAEALAATEEVNQIRGDLEIVGEVNADLTQQVQQMTVVMRENGLDPATPIDAVTPQVDGFVSAIRRRGATQLVEVTIGSDDGLKVGHKVEVFRNAKYLGRIEILKTAPDRAVGRVDTRFQEGRIQEGDRVATRLKLS